MRPGSILLLSCYELGHQPMGLGVPLAALESAGYGDGVTRAVDLSIERLDDAALAHAQIVAISAPMHTALRLGVQTARAVRRASPGATIAFHGLYALLNQDTLLADGLADAVCTDDGAQSLPSLAAALRDGRPLDQIDTLSTRARRRDARPPRAQALVPSRDTLPPLTRYAHFLRGGAHRTAGYVETTQGCKHTCRHCPIPAVLHGRFRAVPLVVALADVRQQVAAGAQHVTIGDPDFLNGPAHAERFLRAAHAEWPDLTFDATIKIEHIVRHAALLPLLAESGVAFVVSAVESLSDRVLAHLDKGHTRQDVFTALALTRAAGLPLRPTFVPFTPWSTWADYVDLLEWVRGERLVHHVDPVQFSIRLLVPPGSLLLGHAESAPAFGPLDRAAFSHAWIHPDPRMDALHADVTAIVREAAACEADDATTFARICDRAQVARAPFQPQLAAPRLTEPWFC